MSYLNNVSVSGSVAITQTAIIDSGNSTTASLAASASFVGTSTATSGYNAIRVSLKTDQNSTLYIEQSSDNTNWDITDTYMYHTSVGLFGGVGQVISPYYRVCVKNTGVSNQTYLRLQSSLCPVEESLPRSLDSNGNLKVGVREIVDNYSFSVENTATGEMRTVVPYRLIGSSFSGSTLDSNYWVSGSGTGSISVSSAQMTLSTGSSTNGGINVQSLRTARYVGGASLRTRIVMRLPDTGTNLNVRRWGSFNLSDGAFFELSGSSLSVVTRKTGVDTPVLNNNFNGQLGAAISVPTTVQTWEIYWTNSKVWFILNDEILHVLSASSTTWSDTMSHPLRFENNNNASASNVVAMNVRTATTYRLGNALTQPTSSYTSGTNAGKLLKVGGGNLVSAIIGSQATTSVVTLYDGINTSGSVIFSYTYTQGAQANNQPFNLDFKGLPFFTGLFLVIGTANSNVLVIYE
jgi:hypothetical protein